MLLGDLQVSLEEALNLFTVESVHNDIVFQRTFSEILHAERQFGEGADDYFCAFGSRQRLQLLFDVKCHILADGRVLFWIRLVPLVLLEICQVVPRMLSFVGGHLRDKA